MKLSKRDKRIIWHPFTQEQTAAEVIAVQRALGSYIYDENDKAYLDLISSWWVNLHGHSHPEIARSIYEQSLKLEHVIFAGFTHEPAVNLCEGLATILPESLNKFFFSDNGSTAVEVAIKMAYQYWRNLGFIEKTMFLSFEGGYHGDTFGAMSVSDKAGFHNQFAKLFFRVLSIPFPDTWDEDQTVELRESEALEVLKQHLKQYSNYIAAVILEPLIQGASGMRKCRSEFVNKVIKLLREHGILIIFDEVMTGFGRTGTYFAMDQLEITPDFLCIAKGITGGSLPLALTITNENIYNAFLSDEFKTAFAHGHSYTANPLACSAAIASLKLLKSVQCQDSIVNINQIHKEGMEFLKTNCSMIEKTRVIGAISAFDIKNISSSHMNTLKAAFINAGLLIRPLGNTVYLLPPYCISAEELRKAYNKIAHILNHLNTY